MRAYEVALRVAGGVLSFLMGTGFALLEVVSTPGFWLMPVLAAATSNVFLVWFARRTVGHPLAWLLAAVPWFGVMVASIGTTGEGDQLANSWTGLATFGVGAFAFFIPVIRPSTVDSGSATDAELR